MISIVLSELLNFKAMETRTNLQSLTCKVYSAVITSDSKFIVLDPEIGLLEYIPDKGKQKYLI